MKKSKLVIVFSANAPYDEVVDSIADALRGGNILEETLEDGFQFQDVLAAAQIQPIVTEIINDVPVFVDQFTKLNPQTAEAAILEARERVIREGGLGKISNAVLKGLYALTTSFKFAVQTYEGGQRQYMLYQKLFAGSEVFPVPVGDV